MIPTSFSSFLPSADMPSFSRSILESRAMRPPMKSALTHRYAATAVASSAQRGLAWASIETSDESMCRYSSQTLSASKLACLSCIPLPSVAKRDFGRPFWISPSSLKLLANTLLLSLSFPLLGCNAAHIPFCFPLGVFDRNARGTSRQVLGLYGGRRDGKNGHGRGLRLEFARELQASLPLQTSRWGRKLDNQTDYRIRPVIRSVWRAHCAVVEKTFG
mmetsp:Transcript_46585/g.113262  ORF Transcript_46585/g.113262 Transcript_46585/m.113262 type:complete len:218 (+) Transcript_46585:2356-3009(+)